MNLVRELSRLIAISSSPIIQKLKESFEGVSSIRFYQKREHHFKQFFAKIDAFQKNSIALSGARNWFAIRISLLSLLVTVPTIFISVRFILFSFIFFFD